MRNLTALSLFFGLVACTDGSKDADDTGTEVVDSDADGISDDTDNCAEVPNDDQADLDGDGWGDVCDSDIDGDTFEGAIDDCDDADAAVNPGADELCDGIDNNCDENIDEDTAVDASTWYADTDADGYGDAAVTAAACAVPTGHVENANDCNDADATISPEGEESCDTIDNDCDGETDEDGAVDAPTWYADVDLDTYGDQNSTLVTCYMPATGYVANWDDCDDLNNAVGIIDDDGDGYNSCTDDCDDTDAYTFPGAAETDSLTDCLTDWDEDGYAPEDQNGTDCDDSDGYTFPGAAEDESTTDCLTDWDEDGWGSEESGGTDCDDGDAVANLDDGDADGVTSCGGDCDDNDPSGTADFVDADGDGASDCYYDCNPNDIYTFPGSAELDSTTACLRDADNDGYGVDIEESCFLFEMTDYYSDWWDDNYFSLQVDSIEVAQLAHLSGASTTEEHCFTTASDISLVWVDGSTDTTDVIMAVTINGTYYDTFEGSYNEIEVFDTSYDYYGTGEAVLTYSPVLVAATDCDDQDVNVTATDDDGDGNVACVDDCDDTDNTLNVNDADGDGYNTCETDADCDDADAAINAAATEVWYDGVDQDCDGWSDYDADGDGEASDQHVDPATSANGTDCDDADADLNTSDTDADGTTSCAGDCNDWDTALNIDDSDADSVSTCDGDCDDSDASVGTTDDDSDGYFTCGPDIDCDDADATTYPGAAWYDSADACVTDADGDGYAASPADTCFTFDMNDSWGDGWNGSYLSVYENGAWVSDHSDTSFSGNTVETVCISGPGVAWTVEFNSIGFYDSEITYTITGDTTGTEYLADGPYPTDGEVLSIFNGSDSDDTDATVQ